MSTLSIKTNKLMTFTKDDLGRVDSMQKKLNDLVTVVIQSQQVRNVFVTCRNVVVSPDDNTWSVVIPAVGFNVGGVVLCAFRASNSNQRTPKYPQSYDFVQTPGGDVRIDGDSGSVPTRGIYFTASFLLIEGT